MTEESLMRFMEQIYKKTFGVNRKYALSYEFSIHGSNLGKKMVISATSALVPHLTYKFEYFSCDNSWILFIITEPNIVLYSYSNTVKGPIMQMEFKNYADSIPKGVMYLKKKVEDLKLYPAELQGLVQYNFI